MSGTGTYPAVTASIGGRQRRLTLERQWRRAIINGDLQRETPIHLQTGEDEGEMCAAVDCPELAALFDEIKGPLENPTALAEEAATENEKPPQIEEALPEEETVIETQSERTKKGSMPIAVSSAPANFGLPNPSGLDLAGIRDRLGLSDKAQSPLQFMLAPLSKYADFQGRARRSEYWWYLLGAAGTLLFALVLFGDLGSGFVSLAILMPTLAVSVRRLHDSGLSGWFLPLFALGMAIPILNTLVLIALIFVMCRPSTYGHNQFGPDPNIASS